MKHVIDTGLLCGSRMIYIYTRIWMYTLHSSHIQEKKKGGVKPGLKHRTVPSDEFLKLGHFRQCIRLQDRKTKV